jgi:hypothetical protein
MLGEVRFFRLKPLDSQVEAMPPVTTLSGVGQR